VGFSVMSSTLQASPCPNDSLFDETEVILVMIVQDSFDTIRNSGAANKRSAFCCHIPKVVKPPWYC
jgi:hypothetical protein